MSKKHMILMLACCVIGMGVAAAVFLFGVPANRLYTPLLILICPLSHFLMMKFMMKGHVHASEEQHIHTNEGHSIHPSPANENR